MHPEEREVEERLGDEVTVGHRVEAVLEAPEEAELLGDEVGVERQRRTGQRSGSEWRDVQPFDARHQAVHVARQRPPMSEEVMRKQHRLRPLEMRVARQVHVPCLTGAVQEDVLECHDIDGDGGERTSRPQAKVGGDLVVAAPSGVELGAHVTGKLGDAPLDGGVDILVVRCECERAGCELLADHVECTQQLVDLFGAHDPVTPEAAHVGLRADQIDLGQCAVEWQTHRELGHHLGHALTEPALPECHAGRASPEAPP